MNSREQVRIAVAETSLILRSGIVAALKRCLDAHIQFVELSEPLAFVRQVKPYAPNILIVNPFFGGEYDIAQCRSNADLGLTDTKIVALQSTVIPANMLSAYDATINLYSSEDELRATFDTLMGVAPTETDTTEPISQREKEIIVEAVKGYTNKEIAQRLNLSVFTVLTHRRNIARKLQIHSATALAIYAIANKLVSIDEVK